MANLTSILPPNPHRARWWEPEGDGKLHCYLCPRHCHIGEGQMGFCFIRVNHGGTLSVGGLSFANRCSWAHVLVEAARVLGLPREDVLTQEELAALDGARWPSTHTS